MGVCVPAVKESDDHTQTYVRSLMAFFVVEEFIFRFFQVLSPPTTPESIVFLHAASKWWAKVPFSVKEYFFILAEESTFSVL